ncbi:MAG: 16S rRNA (uracil(1498)-N(3))-methyltransferase [Gloeomargaritaceae cyanobacterium C42_A2020_066]|nr:16S rRNA (uracil(1498)-N(3))-methyltransferase [Gloeomargaritaceae cyanobacterium C42_A2020_066]
MTPLSHDPPDAAGAWCDLQRLYCPPEQWQAGRLHLNRDQVHYLTHVLRLTPGGRFIALDGRGSWWLARLESVTTAGLEQRLAVNHELPIPITLLVAVPKGDGFDLIVRQATELGVHQVVPLLSGRTQVHPSHAKVTRWQRLAQEAAEQAERQVVPTVTDPCSWETALSLAKGYCGLGVTRRPAAVPLSQWLTPRPAEPITLAFGPEGGWTDTEVEQGLARGFTPITLGPRILRTTTAPLAALAVVATLLEGTLSVD